MTWRALYPSRSVVLTRTTRFGLMRKTVTGITELSSSHTWVIPTFSPTIALLAIFFPTHTKRMLVNLYLCNSMQTLRSGNPGGALISVVPFGSNLFGGPQWTSALGVKTTNTD